ncbi:MAG: BamA/TamA family outer membrane protein [Deltaproteobacteria bacterium]|nr:BamA/TamA family outer membrane protein [Deltaproteobacteria bacterium]
MAEEPPDLPAPLPKAAPPDKASGIAVADEQSDNERLRTVGRGLLFLPKLVFWAAVQPIRGTVYVYERYDLRNRFVDATFTDDRKFGVYPVAGYESAYGFTVGARVLYKDIFDEGERIALRANYGGEFRYALGIGGNTGKRFGRVRIDADSSIERRTREKFYGIGNDHKEIATPLEMPIDPTVTDVALQSRFSQDVMRNVVGVKVRFTDELTTRLSGAWMTREFGGSDKDDITVRYDTSKLIGFDDGLNNIYVDNEVAYDSRRPSTQYATQTIDGTGWLVRAHGGIGRGLKDDPTSYIRYGGEVQRYFDLYRGTRTLALRVLADAVAGTDGRTDGKISFVDLPRLGGSEFLRGYTSGRFRDRVVVLATAEYTWPLMHNASAFTFFDVGEPLYSFDELTKDTDRIRFGYGIGIQVHTRNTFLMRTQIAMSREGNFSFNLVFSPAFGRRDRVGRF